MGKPSITNIKPPSSTSIWTPPKTSWDLNAASDITAAGTTFAWHDGTASTTDGDFNGLASGINTNEASGLNLSTSDLTNTDTSSGVNYDYIFEGVNGGENETVRARENATGIIVTGNGMDVINGTWNDASGGHHTAGSLLVWAGNGKDIVFGSDHSDIIFGENGADNITGNGDNGTASYTPPTHDDGGGESLTFIAPIADGFIAPGDGSFLNNGNYQDNSGSLQKVGFSDADGSSSDPTSHTLQIFSFDPGDEDPTKALNSVHVAAYIYEGDGYSDPTPTKIGDWTLLENQQVYFNVDLNDHPNGGHVVVFAVGSTGNATAAQLADPAGNWLKSQAFDDLPAPSGGNGPATFDYTVGDQLVGGNGPDTFNYDVTARGVGDGVDQIWDFNQGDGGAYDGTQGDQLVLSHTGYADFAALKADTSAYFYWDTDNDSSTSDDLVLYFGTDKAIILTGVTDIDQLDGHVVVQS